MGGFLSHKAVRLMSRSKRTPSRTVQAGDIPDFDVRKKQIIRSTWQQLEQKSPQVAADIFLRIFELRPDVKQFFPFKSAVGEALVSHPYFKGHSVRFLNAVGMTVANLEALEVIHVPNLRKLGLYHTRIPGFSHDIFQVFCEAMNDVWAKYLGRSYSGETRAAWGCVFRFIVDQVEVGYHETLEAETSDRAGPGEQVEVGERRAVKYDLDLLSRSRDDPTEESEHTISPDAGRQDVDGRMTANGDVQTAVRATALPSPLSTDNPPTCDNVHMDVQTSDSG